MSEAPRPDNPSPEAVEQRPRTLSRRRFLKNAAKGAAALGGLGLAARVIPPILFPPGVPPQDEDNPPPVIPRPEGLPEDVLSEEELRQAHIRIIQSDEVKLHLRRGVFEFQLFRDAKENRLKEVVVVLVDHPSLSWNASNKMSKDLQFVYQADVVNPWERSENEWKRKLNPQELERAMVSESENTTVVGFIARFDYPYYNIGSDYADYVMKKGFSGEAMRAQRRLRALQNRDLRNKVFIFVACGGGRKPHSDQSYLSPEQLKRFRDSRAHPPSAYSDGTYIYHGPNIVGKTIWHEIFHYNPGTMNRSEYDADTMMFNSIVDAREEYEKTGKTDRYPFIFETPEGLTFTKNTKSTEKSTETQKIT